jgi:hypothetical protein
MNDPQPEGHMASHIVRRKFLATFGGAVAARAQQPERGRRIGVLMNLASDDAEGFDPARIGAFSARALTSCWAAVASQAFALSTRLGVPVSADVPGPSNKASASRSRHAAMSPARSRLWRDAGGIVEGALFRRVIGAPSALVPSDSRRAS